MNKYGHNVLLNYIDDLIHCGLPSTISHSYQSLLYPLDELGLDINVKKLCPPNTKVVCLDILFDTINRTMSIPDNKFCNSWSDKRMVTKNE